jgi:hypothetical protein
MVWLALFGKVTGGIAERYARDFFPEQVSDNISNFLRSLVALHLWGNRDLSEAVCGASAITVFGRQFSTPPGVGRQP